MSGKLYTYDPSEIKLLVSGFPITGFAPDSIVTIAPEADLWSDVVGCDGDVTRAKSLDRRATVTINLAQSSPSNLVLSALVTADINTPGGASVGPFLCADKHGSSLFTGEACYVKRLPDVEYGSGVMARAWQIRVPTMVPVIGGSQA
jgi:hypothetical protein